VVKRSFRMVHWFVLIGWSCGGVCMAVLTPQVQAVQAVQVSVLESNLQEKIKTKQTVFSGLVSAKGTVQQAGGRSQAVDGKSGFSEPKNVIRKVSTDRSILLDREDVLKLPKNSQNQSKTGTLGPKNPKEGIVFLAQKPLMSEPVAKSNPLVHPVPVPPKKHRNAPSTLMESEPEPKLTSPSKVSLPSGSSRPLTEKRNPFRFFDHPEKGFRFGGWVDAGWYQEQTGLFNQARRQRVHFNQVWFFAEKQLATDHFDLTLRGDLVFGQDAQRFQAFGNSPFGTSNDWDNSLDHGSYGWALPQFYSDLHYAKGKVRSGHFLSPFGYENGPAVENFFYSHTFSYTNSQPHTMTGVLVDHNLSEQTGIYGGYIYGWDSAFDDAGDAGIFGITHRTDSGIALTYNSSFGRLGHRGNGYYQNLSAAYQLTERLQVAVETTWLDTNSVEEFGVASYGIFKINDRWSAGSRAEYWRSEVTGSTTQTSVHSYTYGLNYRPHPNIVMRPELRTDYGNAAVADGDTGYAFDVVITF